jgi:hypothetical protein
VRREKSRRRRTIEALVLAALLLFEVWAVDFVLTPTPTTAIQWSGIRATRGELDALFLGSSHAHCSITPMEMWRESGVTGASITGPSQPLSITAAYLEEALHSQDPKVVMADNHEYRVNMEVYNERPGHGIRKKNGALHIGEYHKIDHSAA